MLKYLLQTILLSFLIITYSVKATEIYEVKQSSIGTTVTLGGTVIPYKEVTLSAQVPGRVKKIAGEEGDKFAENAVLVKIDDTVLRAKRRSAEAAFYQADAALRNANIQYSRELWSPESPQKSAPGGMGLPFMFDQFFTQPMSDVMGRSSSGLDRQADLHNFGSQIDQARSALMQARSQIEQIDASLRDALSKAPFNGVIIRKLIEEGDTVQPGMPLIEFADTEYLQIKVDVPARLVTGLKKGMTVPAKLDVSDKPALVRVAQIFPTADPNLHTVTVKFDLPIGTQTGPGQYAEVEIQDVTVPVQNLPIIPRSAIIWRGSLPAIRVVTEKDGEKKTQLRLIRLGRDIDQQQVSVLSGVSAGDKVELNPKPAISSGWTSKSSNNNH
ncbi:efflux RND transporter periplasmic adaptor subunit [Candidatus Albibeggiatoa sp. nov. NOAA]|uniref:efflux RND transporter periplasmic adaptor subunit n=1 Tax=Candidatus Albibeggiatoa sp. nov. NOAA TaxID=3162724 RepID=UPI003304D66F|nr:efflux RND transporter periplasmic adaptor subunit [Thiotrichaceae bacterium]